MNDMYIRTAFFVSRWTFWENILKSDYVSLTFSPLSIKNLSEFSRQFSAKRVKIALIVSRRTSWESLLGNAYNYRTFAPILSEQFSAKVRKLNSTFPKIKFITILRILWAFLELLGQIFEALN